MASLCLVLKGVGVALQWQEREGKAENFGAGTREERARGEVKEEIMAPEREGEGKR